MAVFLLFFFVSEVTMLGKLVAVIGIAFLVHCAFCRVISTPEKYNMMVSDSQARFSESQVLVFGYETSQTEILDWKASEKLSFASGLKHF